MCGNSARETHTHTGIHIHTYILAARKYTYAHYVIAGRFILTFVSLPQRGQTKYANGNLIESSNMHSHKLALRWLTLRNVSETVGRGVSIIECVWS